MRRFGSKLTDQGYTGIFPEEYGGCRGDLWQSRTHAVMEKGARALAGRPFRRCPGRIREGSREHSRDKKKYLAPLCQGESFVRPSPFWKPAARAGTRGVVLQLSAAKGSSPGDKLLVPAQHRRTSSLFVARNGVSLRIPKRVGVKNKRPCPRWGLTRKL